MVASGTGKYPATVWDTTTGKAVCLLETGSGASSARFSCVEQGETGYRVAGITRGSAATWNVS